MSATDPRPGAPAADQLCSLAVQLAEGAAALVQDGRRSTLSVDAKSSATDLVTQVDRASERWLVQQLAQLRPGDAVLGEEGGDRAGTTGVRWIVDPIDGTVNFVLGLPQYAVSVAAEVDGQVVAGAVCNPATGETFRAWRGGGSYLGDRKLTGPRAIPVARAVIGTGFSYDAATRSRQVEVVSAILAKIADVRRLGSAALDLCYLAAGRLDGYFEAGLHPWDCAAGGLIATEAGCLASGLGDRPASGRFYAAAGPELANEFFALLEAAGAAEVL